MTRKKGLALFDMDQTLVESDFAWAEAFSTYAGEIGFENPEEFYTQFFEKDFGYLIDRIIERKPELDVSSIFVDVAALAEENYKNKVMLKSGAIELVSTMKEEGYLTAILTANNPKLSNVAKERFQDILGIDHWYSVQEMGVSKGDSYVYDLLSDMHGIDKDCFILFDDATYAVETAYNAGIKVVKIYNPRDSKEKEGFPYPLLESLEDFDLSMLG